MKLGSKTSPAAGRAIARGAVALLPIGATEAHGPHLPLDTDVRIARATCERAVPIIAERFGLDALLLPSIAYSVTDYASGFAGTIGVSAEAATAYLRDVFGSAAAQGFAAVVGVNAHLEPAHRRVLREAAAGARGGAPCPVVLADPCDRRWVPRLTEEFRSGKCHAGRYETSLILADDGPVHPFEALSPVDIDLVGQMQAGKERFLDMGANEAYFGAPAEATAAEGHATYAVLAEIVVLVLAEALDRPSPA